MTFRGLLMWIHLVLGLTGAIVLGIVGVTGAYITFQVPLERWLNPVPRVAVGRDAPDILAMVAAAESRGGSPATSLEVRPAGEAAVVLLRDRTTVFVDPASATVVGSRPRRFASLYNLTRVMRGLHASLLLGPKGRLVVTFVTLEALLLVLTGLWLWWRKKAWRFGPWRGSPFRVSWDLHSASGIWFAAPVLAMVVTGLLLAIPSPIYRMAGAEPAPWLDSPGSASAGPSAEAIPLARAIAVADSAIPGVPVSGLAMPPGPRGSFGVRKGNTTVFVDRFTGGLVEVRANRQPTTGDAAFHYVETLHTGEAFGIPGRAIMTIGSLMLAVMTVTGVILGWKRLLILAGRMSRD